MHQGYWSVNWMCNLMSVHSEQPAINEPVKKVSTNLLISSLFAWIKPANVIQVIGQLLNLVRSLVSFQLSEKFSWNLIFHSTENSPVTCQHQACGQTVKWPEWCWQIWFIKILRHFVIAKNWPMTCRMSAVCHFMRF